MELYVLGYKRLIIKPTHAYMQLPKLGFGLGSVLIEINLSKVGYVSLISCCYVTHVSILTDLILTSTRSSQTQKGFGFDLMRLLFIVWSKSHGIKKGYLFIYLFFLCFICERESKLDNS